MSYFFNPITGQLDRVGGSAASTLFTVELLTATRPLTIGDRNKLFFVDSNSPQTFTIPSNADLPFPIGTIIDFVQAGAGGIAVTPALGVTILPPRPINTDRQSARISCIKIALNTWYCIGDLARFTQSVTFSYTGADQTFTVPYYVSEIQVHCWGAAGGAPIASGVDVAGGPGGYSTAIISVSPGQVLTVRVGGGGRVNDPILYGGGGSAVTGRGTNCAAHGGGLSGILIDNLTPLIIAGGGGGAGRWDSFYYKGGKGGGGIGETAGDYTGNGNYAGKGGSQNGGGARGDPTFSFDTQPSDGSFLSGGQGGSEDSNRTGGGGGGGYYGGGGGSHAGGGGGGSGFVPPGGITLQGVSNTQPAGTTVTGYNGTAGVSVVGGNGNHGLVIIRY